MILHVWHALSALSPITCAVVVGHQRDQVMEALAGKSIEFVIQEQQHGTAHAVSEFLKQYPDIDGLLLVLSGDTPLLQPSTLLEMIQLHKQRSAVITLLTMDLSNPAGYGRVIRNPQGTIERIIEEADANEVEKAVREVNAGVYAFDIPKTARATPACTAGK